MSPIDLDREVTIRELLHIENKLYNYFISINDTMVLLKSRYPDLYKDIYKDLDLAQYRIDKAHDIIYNHNIKLNLTYENED